MFLCIAPLLGGAALAGVPGRRGRQPAVSAQGYKLAAGACVLYPATHLHRVAPVLRGQRHAAVGWVQSLVRDAGPREPNHERREAP